MKTAEELSTELTTKRIRDLAAGDWRKISAFGFKADGLPVKVKIQQLLDAGKIVRTGYTTTSVRGYHDKWILWREPAKKQPFWEDLADKSKDGFRRNLSSPTRSYDTHDKEPIYPQTHPRQPNRTGGLGL